ncbi:MAG TPA: SUMF1/EgtB/PvdO family nonheme iron enzyme [Acidobacteriota bacterium]|nr:SUMF1/EgtB/PvdO family nonheme iron enzyme [Acidobacteriota bacterium]
MDVQAPTTQTIPEGWFWMGSEDGRPNEQPVHRVWVDAFAIALHPVTNRDYERFLQDSGQAPPKGWDDSRFNQPRQPVVGVTWFEARDYCRWLAQETGRPFRLPSEAEREKAARGGMEGRRYPWGDDEPDWMEVRGRGHTFDELEEVAQDPPNGYGLHNMGNLVHEWCRDWYDADYYKHSPQHNPQGPESGVRRASRGGSWRHRIKITPCAARTAIPPDRTHLDYGFRPALELP